MDPSISRYFISPNDITSRFDELYSRSTPITVETYARIMHPVWYWFHFKHITMPRIATLCKQYDADMHGISQQGTRIWRRWFRLFDASVRALGGEGVGRDGMVVRALLSTANRVRGRF